MLSLKEKEKKAWLAFVVFIPDNVFPAFKTFFWHHSLKESNFIHNKNLLCTIPLSPYNYSQHFGIIFVAFITMLAFRTSHFYILNIGTNFKLIEPHVWPQHRIKKLAPSLYISLQFFVLSFEYIPYLFKFHPSSALVLIFPLRCLCKYSRKKNTKLHGNTKAGALCEMECYQ